ncbi:hypothetical protein CDCA_CDCA01G0098 [Cyanidium caldarium]|uniref:Glycerophosphocholine acyltransferase 1 n=1 Tax=Cyanidium caldarium TaxID=2771 RepID=A0AAV9IPB0_CYACA|nr:hypothetical protein CDCA_CDCA01G0098 [Cyanidium caldarium]
METDDDNNNNHRALETNTDESAMTSEDTVREARPSSVGANSRSTTPEADGSDEWGYDFGEDFDGLRSLSLGDLFLLGHLSRLEDRIRRTRKRISAQRRALVERARTPEIVRLRDKLSFVLGLLNVLVTEHVLLRHPSQLWNWYLGQMIPLLLLRYYLYRKSFQHYFMYDYCYFVQALLVAFYFGWPRNHLWRQAMFVALFASANGPVLWAVVAWRNALVFHSLDKMTSVFIHVFPPLVTYMARWHPEVVIDLGRRRVGICDSAAECFALGRRRLTLAVPLVIFLVWQSLYLLKILVVSRKKLDRNPEMITSLRYMTRRGGSGLYRMLNIFGTRYQNLALAFWQLLFTVFTCLPTVLMWRCRRLHEVVLALVGLTLVWNGSSYYFEVFASRYTRHLLQYARDRMDAMNDRRDGQPASSSSEGANAEAKAE